MKFPDWIPAASRAEIEKFIDCSVGRDAIVAESIQGTPACWDSVFRSGIVAVEFVLEAIETERTGEVDFVASFSDPDSCGINLTLTARTRKGEVIFDGQIQRINAYEGGENAPN